MADKKNFTGNIAWMFNIGWMMMGSVAAGFLIGKGLYLLFEIKWPIIVFSLAGAAAGMRLVWQYYKRNL